MKYKIYIITLNYNGWADTIECLESVLRNDYHDYQVIVLDNNSPNNSIEYIKAWAEGKLDVWVNPYCTLRRLSYPPVPKPIPYVYYNREEAEKGGNLDIEKQLEGKIPEGITTKYPLVFIQTGENLGFAGGNNVGTRYALAKDDFEYILFLNNDTVIEPRTLRVMVEVARETKASVVGAVIRDYSNKRIIFSKSSYPAMFFYYQPQRHIINQRWWQSDRVEASSMLVHKGLLLERWNTLGYFLDESLFLYCEEIELAMWCRQLKRTSVVAGEAVAYHKVGTSTGGKGKPSQFYYLTRNRVLLARRYLQGPLRIIFEMFYPIWRVIRAGIYLFRRQPEIAKAILDGLLDGYRGKTGMKP